MSAHLSDCPKLAQPLFRWAGSKRRLVPRLAQYWNDQYNRYVEPFVGSACLFFALRPRIAILGDINEDLIGAYTAIRADPDEVSRSLESIPPGKRSYYRLRAKNPAEMSSADRAARFIFLNRYCFNGLYRTNLQGRFNVPFSPAKTGTLPSRDDLRAAANRLANAELRRADFEEVIRTARRGDFVYADPPYAVKEHRVFREYHPNSFSVRDIPRLAATLKRVDNRGVHFVLTYADCAEFREFFGHWPMYSVSTPRNISGFAQHRKTATELIVTNITTS